MSFALQVPGKKQRGIDLLPPKLPVAKSLKSWHLRTSSFERTPQFGGFHNQIA
jgi:hypothetical protein